jgi:hypothetical protein
MRKLAAILALAPSIALAQPLSTSLANEGCPHEPSRHSSERPAPGTCIAPPEPSSLRRATVPRGVTPYG